MAIQWYPGHMHKARKEIARVLPQVDILIEMLDARIPWSSQNPLIDQLRADKPCIKVLSKSDLADAQRTEEWVQYLEQQKSVRALPVSSHDPGRMKLLLNLCRKLLPAKDASCKTLHTMIVGIPNVGKSTLINTLAGKSIARTGNEPAVTRNQQRINLGNGILLMDTPGMLWPRVENENSGYRLAATGAIKSTAMEFEDVGFWLAGQLLRDYPELLRQRFQIESLAGSEIGFLEQAAARRGALGSGGRVNLHKICEILVNELRSGSLGRITLETPAIIASEQAQVEAERAAREAKKQQRKQDFRQHRNKQDRKQDRKKEPQ